MDASAWVAVLAACVAVIFGMVQYFVTKRQADIAQQEVEAVRKQVGIAQQEVDASAFVDLMNSFRQPSFHENYEFVTKRLQEKYDTAHAVPLFDITGDDGRAVLDVTYFFQNCAALADYGIVSEVRMMGFLHLRFAHVWEAIAPYVLAERSRLGFTVLSNLESMAIEARKRSEEDVHRDMLLSSKRFGGQLPK